MIRLAETHRILVVDDEPDVAAVTRLSLKGMRHRGRPVELVVAATGAEAVDAMRAEPDIAVILLDVVMETETAGLDACCAIRQDLGNDFVRILLRTGQPGVAPERATIDEYDIDGYMLKSELSSNRLYAAVKTALRAFEDLVELERNRQVLALLNDTAVSLRSFEPFELTLQRILGAAMAIVPTSLAVLDLHTHDHQGDPLRWLLHLSSSGDDASAAAAAAEVADRVGADLASGFDPDPGTIEGGYLAPFTLHREIGYGWLYLDGVVDDPLARVALPLLACHAANALTSAAMQAMLRDREGPFYDSLIV